MIPYRRFYCLPLSGSVYRLLLTLLLSIGVILTLFGTSLRPVHAGATIVVNSTLASSPYGDGKCTLIEAIRNANADAQVSSDCLAGSGADTITFNLSGPITITPNDLDDITSDITIPGAGHVTIDGSAGKLFLVASGSHLTLDSITINNGNRLYGGTYNQGGAIQNWGTLTVTNSTFNSNMAETGGAIWNDAAASAIISNTVFASNIAISGGALYNMGTLSLTNVTLSSNYSAGTGDSDGGGGIYSVGTLTVDHSTFSDNREDGTQGGGGIYNYGSMNVTDSSFTSNVAAYGGGLESDFPILAVVNVTNTTFSSNTASFGGGGIYIYTGKITVSGCTFYANQVTADSGLGGGMMNNSGTVVVDRTTFDTNTTAGTGNGGGFENYRNKAIANATATITNSTFTSNAANYGAGLMNYDGVLSLSNSTFSSNAASAYGGGVEVSSTDNPATATIVNSTFSGNTATTGGGAILNYASTVTINSSTFAGNSALNGGALYNYTSTKYVPIFNLAGNLFAKGAQGANYYHNGGTIANPGYNLSDDASFAFTGTSKNSTPLNLGPLATNDGGITQTILPNSGSPAIGGIPKSTNISNNGTPLSCNGSSRDQNTILRPRVTGDACTSGAVEAVISPQIVVSGPEPTVIARGDTYNMGETLFGTPLAKTITVHNIGSKALTLLTSQPTTTTGFSAGNFVVTSLAANASTTFPLTCTAAALGQPVTGTVTITTSDPLAGTFSFTVHCTVDSPDLSVTTPEGALLANGGTYDMGTTTVGLPMTKAFTIHNGGTAPLHLLTNPPSKTGDFTTAAFGSTTVNIGNTTTFNLTCSATQAGTPTVTGTVSFNNDDHSKNPFTFTAVCTVVSTPFPAPDNLVATSGSQTTMGLTWNDNAADEAAYKVERSLDGVNGWQTIASLDPGTINYEDTVLYCSTLYYYRVRGYRDTDQAYSNYSNVASATTAACTMPAPLLSAPVNGSLTSDNAPTFSWQPVGGADSYEIQIDNDSDFSSPTQHRVTTDPSYPAATLADGTTYYWHVRALNSGTNVSSVWSAAWTVQIDKVRLAAPGLLNPANAANVTVRTPALSWSAVLNAVQYQLEIDTTPQFNSSPFSHTLTRLTSYTATVAVDNLQYGTTYYWHVRANDASGTWSDWSTVRSFTLTVLLGPANGSYALVSRPVFTWAAIAGASYTVVIADNAALSSPVYPPTAQSTTSFTPPLPGLTDKQYWWTVHVVAPGIDAVMQPWTVTVTTPIPAAPVMTLAQPPNAKVTNVTTPYFAWGPTSTPTGGTFDYQFQIATTSTFYTPTLDVRTGGALNYTPSTGLADGLYYWRVRAINRSDTAGLWSAPRTVTIDTTAPPAPVLTTPRDWSATNAIRPMFAWAPVTGAYQYVLEVFTGANCNSLPGSPTVTMTLPTTPSPAPPTSYTIPALSSALGYGAYCWHVKAIDAATNVGQFSAWFHLSVVKETILTPGIPVLSTPPNAGLYQSIAPLSFTWTTPGTTPITQYEFQIDTVATFLHPVQDTLTAVPPLTANALPDGLYYWHVRAFTSQGVASAWSAYRSFTLDSTAPAGPTLLLPAANGSVTVLRPTLSWQALTGTKTYHVQVNTDSGFGDATKIADHALLTTTSYVLALTEQLSYGTIYYWRVQATDLANNPGQWSTRSFTVTVQMAPANGVTVLTGRPSFAWLAVTGAKYTVQIGSDPDVANHVVLTSPQVSTTSWVIPTTTAALTPGLYYWRVQVNSTWMQPWPLRVTTVLPAVPLLAAPATNALTGDNTPTFAWKSALNAASYEIQIDDLSTFASPNQDVTGAPGILSYTADRLSNGKYYWRVRGLTTAGAAGNWSAAWILNVDALAPNIPVPTGPVDGASITNPLLILRWNAATGAATYQVQITPDGGTPIPPLLVGAPTSYKVPMTLSSGLYSWQVRAVDTAGNMSDWSVSRTFRVVAGYTLPGRDTPTATATEAATAAATESATPPESATPEVSATPTTTAPATATETATAAPTETPTPAPTLTENATTAPATVTPAATATPVPLRTVEAEGDLVVRAGTWAVQASSTASGGQYVYSGGQISDTLTLGFSGSTVTVIYVKHPALGTFAIQVDGQTVQTVVSTDPNTVFGTQAVVSGLTLGAHVLRIVPVQGTVAIDAFEVEAVTPVSTTATATPIPSVAAPAAPATIAPVAAPATIAPPAPLPTMAPLPTQPQAPTSIPIQPGPIGGPTGAPIPIGGTGS